MIIGITGTIGSGKGSVVEYLLGKGFKHVAVSDTFLAGEAVKRGLPPDRPNRRDIANEYRSQGPTKLMEAVYELARPLVEAREDVVLEPQHTAGEVDFIHSIGGIEFSVDADLDIRYKRVSSRGGSKDGVSFEEFRSHHEHEMSHADPHRNNLGAAIAKADYHILNNGTKEELHQQIEEVLKQIK